MKRFILVGLILLLGVSIAYAVPPVMITNANGSNEVKVSADGKLITTQWSRKTLSIVGSGQIYTGSCFIQSINYYGAATGDIAGIYDLAKIATGAVTAAELEFEIGVSASTSSVSIPASGSPIVNGIYVGAKTATAITTVVIDY